MHTTPYLNLNGTCRDAFTLYQHVFGGDLMLMTYADAPPGDGFPELPPEEASKVMHVALSQGGPQALLMGSDMPLGREVTPSGAISVALNSATVAEAERIFAALSEGGSVQMPMAETFWSQRFGMTTDRFGVQWLINGPDKTL